MKRLVALLLVVFCGVANAELIGPSYPVTVGSDGKYTIHREAPVMPEVPSSWWENVAWATGFDFPFPTASAYGWDNTVCTNVGTFGGLTVPRCAMGTSPNNGSFYLAFGLSATPASAPSFTASFDIVNQGDTTAAHHWCYRASCAVITAGGNGDTTANLTFGTVSSLADNQFTSPCNATGKTCVGAATGSFTCTDNGTAAGCSGTACNDHLVVIKAEPRTSSCGATVTTSNLDYGLVHLVEAN